MTDPYSPARTFGLVLSPASKLNVTELCAALAADGAKVLTGPASRTVLACWGFEETNTHFDAERVSVVLSGSPRLRGADAKDLTAADVATMFVRQGADLLDGIAGNFCLSLIDHGSGRALLAIDRIGVESGYYRPYADGSLAFATDLALLREYVGSDLSWSNQAIYDYVYFHVVPAPLTIYSEIYKLPPSHALQHASDGQKVSRYWVPTFAARPSGSLTELSTDLKQSLNSSVQRCRETSPDTVGAFLSGGLDSSTVCGMLAGQTNDPVTAVSVGFDQAGYDEIEFARIAVRHFGLEHCVHYITTEEIADSVSLIADAYAEPFGNSSAVPTYICAQAARQNGLSTLLAGDGGDELFGGNSRYVRQQLFETYWRLPAVVRSGVMEPLFAGEPRAWQVGPLHKLHRYVEQARVPLPHRLHTENMLEMNQPASVFGDDFLSGVDVSHALRVMQEEYSATGAEPSVLHRLLAFDWRFTLADNDIRKVSRMCELAGLDVRYPFLDDDVLDMSLKVPPRMKIRGFRLRHFYKQALKDFLPGEIINKPKHGFGLPFGEWLLGSQRLQEMVYDSLADLSRRGMFRRAFIDKLIEHHRSEHAAFYGDEVWVLAMLGWWLERHPVSAATPAQPRSA